MHWSDISRPLSEPELKPLCHKRPFPQQQLKNPVGTSSENQTPKSLIKRIQILSQND